MTSKAKFREQFTIEERRAYMQAKTDRLADSLKEGVASFKNTDKFKDLLVVAAKFANKYSFHNWIMIYQQNPDATRVMSKKDWYEKFGRTIIRSEYGKPINIWVPFFGKSDESDEKGLKGFGIGPVYDISQTEGPDIPSFDWRGIESEEGESVYNALLAYAEKKGIKVIQGESEDGEGGWWNRETRTIKIVPASRAIMARCLAHEVAHSQDVNLDATRPERETVADSVAYMVCSAFDIPTGNANFEYIASWTRNDAGIKTLEKVMKVVKAIGGELIEVITDYIEEQQAVELVAA